MGRSSQHMEQQTGLLLQQRLSPLQVRYVRLLEMNDNEAAEAVERELADNPALAVAEDTPQTLATEDGGIFTESAEELQRKDYADADEIPYYRLRQTPSGRESYDLTPAPDDSDDLYSSLNAQLGELHIDADDREVAEYVIGNLDSNGYLRRSPAGMISDLAISAGREVSAQQMKRALEAVRSLDPAGVGAENLEQSMELQLARLPETQERSDALRIVKEAWDPFLKRHAHRICSLLHIDATRTAQAMNLISSLNPKPGSPLGSGRGSRAAAVSPDFYVEADDNGELRIGLAGRHVELTVEASFESAMKLMQSRTGKERMQGADYVAARYNDARDFISLMRQRRDTLLSVITAIASLQREYFLTADDSTLRPMTLRDVAALTGHDPSTVSRATSGKYVQTRAGIKPLRYFFSEGYTSTGGDDISARQVQAALKALVDGEDSRHPLSDEALCRDLAAQGLEVSRRTVAKYRDRMNIPVARLRKK